MYDLWLYDLYSYFTAVAFMFASVFCFWVPFFFNLAAETHSTTHITTCMQQLPNVCAAKCLHGLALCQNITQSVAKSGLNLTSLTIHWRMTIQATQL